MSAQPETPYQPDRSPSRWLAMKRRLIRWALLIGVLLILGISGWIYATLHFSYSTGERVGYIQKMSNKGWICKTWEGELAMLNQPGVPAQIFAFTVRDDAVAQNIMKNAGQRVSLSYSQHRGVPTSCFGETEYYVTGVTPLGP